MSKCVEEVELKNEKEDDPKLMNVAVLLITERIG